MTLSPPKARAGAQILQIFFEIRMRSLRSRRLGYLGSSSRVSLWRIIDERSDQEGRDHVAPKVLSARRQSYGAAVPCKPVRNWQAVCDAGPLPGRFLNEAGWKPAAQGQTTRSEV